jgi:hypothetical protein
MRNALDVSFETLVDDEKLSVLTGTSTLKARLISVDFPTPDCGHLLNLNGVLGDQKVN